MIKMHRVNRVDKKTVKVYYYSSYAVRDAAYMCSGMRLLRECVEKEYNDGKVHKGRHIEEG